MNLDKRDNFLKDPSVRCPRCERTFECKPDDISSCNCSKIELSKEEYRFISSKFQVCVCNACLRELKNEYNMNHHYNKPKNFRDRTFSVIFFLALFFSADLSSQIYAPPVGQAGTQAMYKDSTAFISWATGCVVSRGYQDISNTSLGFTTVGDGTMATGKAQNNAVVSLGDGGSAICTFAKPVMNGAGFDFAVFENGFDDVFLELAFVEVSSDGLNFFRFHAHSLTDTLTQTSSFGSTDATKINNLAGKYRGGYGTPFDLQDLAGTVGLDINNVTHIKITDVVGSINKTYATRDFYNNKINHSWPTAFPSGGFDLDAVGVIHESVVVGIKEERQAVNGRVYPNPVMSGEYITIQMPSEIKEIEVLDLSGRCFYRTKEQVVPTSGLNAGMYSLRIITENGTSVQKIIVH